jgi:mono/diheme cytochrome c family protein
MKCPKWQSKIAAVFLFAGLSACRQDMHNQPRYKPLAATDFFGDGRSARPVIEDTVARGHLRLNDARYTGKVNGKDVETFPFPITRADLARGQERFNIYCSPCHGRLGNAQGMVVKRGFKAPPSYTSERVMKLPVGHYFDVVTNGFGSMPSYASRVAVDDRWRVIAYVKALQYSETATVNDVPADRRADLDKSPAELMEEQPRLPASENPAERPPVPAPARKGTDVPRSMRKSGVGR